MEIVRNAAKCLKCLEILESIHRHDFRMCKCGNLFVDGGRDYIRRGAEDLENILDLTEYSPEDY